MEVTNYRLRLVFRKVGRARFLSHLETVHSLERVVRRAGLPFAVTQGFSPHMKLAFGPALPVGCAGLGEYLEVWLTDYVPAHRALEALQAASASGLMVTEASYVTKGDPSLTEYFTVFEYETSLDLGELGLADDAAYAAACEAAVSALLEKGYIEVERKKKVKRIELSSAFRCEPRVLGAEGGVVRLAFTVQSSPESTLRPDILLARIAAEAGVEPRIVSMTRVACLPAGEA